MALSMLTNVKTILSLGPKRSILGTIIRPDSVLLERKGGSNGEVTFKSLLPGAGEPLEPQYEDQQEILGNWQLGDPEEEPLPRGNGIAEESGSRSSGKKRKTSKEKSRKKMKENEEVGVRHEENGSRKERSGKKGRWRNREREHDDGKRVQRQASGSPWRRSG